MRKSANQLYKESKSELPFKKWLKAEQQNGNLQDHEAMFNADGKTSIDKTEDKEEKEIQEAEVVVKKNKTTTSIRAKNNGILNFIGLVSLGVLVYGLHKATQQQA